MGIVTEQDLIDTINDVESTPAPVADAPVSTENPTPIPPAADAPVIPAKADDQPPAQPVFNLDEELQKISNGEITSKDQLAEILGKTKGISELEAKLKTYEEENTSLKAKAEVSPFANDFTKKMNDLYKSGVQQSTIDAFVKINKVENIDDLQPIEARKLALQIKEGLTAEEAEAYVKGTYKLTQEDPDDEAEATAVRLANIKLKVDANSDKEFLKTHKANVSTPAVDNSEKEAKDYADSIKKQSETLLPIAKSVISALAFKDIVINGKDGEAAIKMDLEMTPESKTMMENRMMELVNTSPQTFPNTPEGIEKLKQTAENLVVLQNWKSWIATSVNTREKDVRAEYHNPTTPSRGTDNPNVGKTSNEELGDWILANS